LQTSEKYYESQWGPLTQPQYKLTKVSLGSVEMRGGRRCHKSLCQAQGL